VTRQAEIRAPALYLSSRRRRGRALARLEDPLATSRLLRSTGRARSASPVRLPRDERPDTETGERAALLVAENRIHDQRAGRDEAQREWAKERLGAIRELAWALDCRVEAAAVDGPRNLTTRAGVALRPVRRTWPAPERCDDKTRP